MDRYDRSRSPQRRDSGSGRGSSRFDRDRSDRDRRNRGQESSRGGGYNGLSSGQPRGAYSGGGGSSAWPGAVHPVGYSDGESSDSWPGTQARGGSSGGGGSVSSYGGPPRGGPPGGSALSYGVSSHGGFSGSESRSGGGHSSTDRPSSSSDGQSGAQARTSRSEMPQPSSSSGHSGPSQHRPPSGGMPPQSSSYGQGGSQGRPSRIDMPPQPSSRDQSGYQGRPSSSGMPHPSSGSSHSGSSQHRPPSGGMPPPSSSSVQAGYQPRDRPQASDGGFGGGSFGNGRPDSGRGGFGGRGGRDASSDRNYGSRDSSMDRGGSGSRDSSMDRSGNGSRDSNRGSGSSSWGGRGRTFDRGPRGRGDSRGGRGWGGGGGGGGGGPQFSYDSPKDICDQAPPKKEGQRGTIGERIEIRTNFVRMRLANQGLYTYRVDFDPPVESRRKKYALVMGLKSTHSGQFIPDAMLISKFSIGNEQGELELEALMKVRGENGPEEVPVKIRFRKTGQITLENPTDFMHIINNLAKSGLRKMGLTQIKHSYYAMSHKTSVDVRDFPGLLRVPSYENPVNIRHGGFLMNITIRERLLRQDTVLDQIRRIQSRNRGDFRMAVEAELIGQIVQLKYSGRTFKIGEIKWDLNPNSKYREDSEETVLQYYKKHFANEPEAKINDDGQPLLIAEPTAKDRRRENMERTQPSGPKKIHLVPELCRMTGLVGEIRNNPKKMRDLAMKLRKDPKDRVKDCRNFIGEYGKHETREMLAEFNLAMEEDIVTVSARQLKDISLTMGGRKLAINRASFESCLKSMSGAAVSIENKGTLKNWAVIVDYSEKFGYEAWEQQFLKVLRSLKPDVPPPAQVHKIHSKVSGDFTRKIDEIINKDLDLVLVIVPDGEEARYAAVKKRLNCDHGIPCQVVQGEKVRVKNMSVTTKICAQVIAKTGGALWACPSTKSDTMIIGFDLYKPKAGKGNAVSAMVASLNDNMTAYTSVSFNNHGDQFVSQNFNSAFEACLAEYKKRNSAYPKRIVVYRGGVAHGELDTLKNMEIKVMHDHLKTKGSTAGIGYIVVNKRVNVHFFHLRGGEFLNPPDGLVVDTTITNREANDFYLVPQSPTQGCVNPVYYQILEDTIEDFSMDYYQLLTFKLTHTYYNWMGAIRVPGVLQYATKLGTLVGAYTHSPLHQSLRNRLAFL